MVSDVTETDFEQRVIERTAPLDPAYASTASTAPKRASRSIMVNSRRTRSGSGAMITAPAINVHSTSVAIWSTLSGP